MAFYLWLLLTFWAGAGIGALSMCLFIVGHKEVIGQLSHR
jgi:hypothetical protein